MSGTGTVSVSTVSGLPSFLRANRVLAFELPPPDETWHRRTAPEMVAEHLSKLQANHVVDVAERYGAPTEHNAHTYRTNRAAWHYIQTTLEEPTTLDCGHSGIRNLGDGEYTCAEDDCDSRFGRETAREVLSG